MSDDIDPDLKNPVPDAPLELTAEEVAKLDAALGLEPDPTIAVTGTSQAATPATAPQTSSATASPSAPAATEPATKTTETVELDSNKLLAILATKKKVQGDVDAQAAKVQAEKAELEKARQDLADARALIDLAVRDPDTFYRTKAGLPDTESVAKALWESSEAGKKKAPQQYQQTQRTRDIEAEIQRLRNELTETRNGLQQERQAQEYARVVNDYATKAKEVASKSDVKSAPWVSRMFKQNPERVAQEIVGLAKYVAAQGGEVPEDPATFIPVLEARMVEAFGKYDIGEAKPAVTLDSRSLAAPPNRPPVGKVSEEDLDEDIIRAIKAGEHLRE